MASSISSLGIGSGVLTADIIDQLREADESRIIKPIDSKIELQKQKEESSKLLDELLTTFKSSISTLSYDTIYQSRTVDVTNGNLEVIAEAGANIQSFSLETVALAQQNIQQSGSFTARSDTVADGAGTMNITIGASTYNIAYTATTTLDELAQAINDEAGSLLTASVLQTGEDAYSLILTSDETGADQTISVSDTPDIAGSGLINTLYNDQTATSGFTSVLDAQDTEFIYNGITINRSGNEVSDLINGVTLTLKTEGEVANVAIEQDTLAVTTEMTLMVESYNALQTNLHDMALSDTETGTMGVFNGDNFVKSIMREINSIITSTDANGNSLVNYGIDIDRYGVMSFDESAFEAKLKSDPDATELFLSGGYDMDTGITTTGLFETLNDQLNEYTKFNGLFDNFEQGLEKRSESLSEDRARALTSLDSRYEILTKQFLAYDAIISKINAQFASLNMMIQAEANADK